MSNLTLTPMTRIAMGTILKGVGSGARILDFKSAGDAKLLKAEVAREGVLLTSVAAATYGLEHLNAALAPMVKASPVLSRNAALLQFGPLLLAYGLAEFISRKMSGLNQELKRTVAKGNEAGPKTVNLFLNGINGSDDKAASPQKVMEVQFAAQPLNNMGMQTAATANYFNNRPAHYQAYNGSSNAFSQRFDQTQLAYTATNPFSRSY